jgi:phospholipase D1/2
VTDLNAGGLAVWLRLAAVLVICGSLLAAWTWSPTSEHLDQLVVALAAHRHAWYALPGVMLAFVVLGLMMVPVILLIAVTGIAFGPLLGSVYAMAGCLASASVGFAIGRWLGLPRIRQWGGDRVAGITRAAKRNGTLAVFLLRKIPAPFLLVNIVVGASMVPFRDFMVGTTLGMGVFVVGLAGFGYQLTTALIDPSPETLVGAALFVAVPLTLAVLINRRFRRMRTAE